jgi:hypothetical protein
VSSRGEEGGGNKRGGDGRQEGREAASKQTNERASERRSKRWCKLTTNIVSCLAQTPIIRCQNEGGVLKQIGPAIATVLAATPERRNVLGWRVESMRMDSFRGKKKMERRKELEEKRDKSHKRNQQEKVSPVGPFEF